MSRGQSERSAAARRYALDTISVTCCMDDRAHEVADAELAMAATRRDGYCQALCGHMIAAGPMVMPDGEPCQLCAAIRDRRTGRRRQSGFHRALC